MSWDYSGEALLHIHSTDADLAFEPTTMLRSLLYYFN